MSSDLSTPSLALSARFDHRQCSFSDRPQPSPRFQSLIGIKWRDAKPHVRDCVRLGICFRLRRCRSARAAMRPARSRRLPAIGGWPASSAAPVRSSSVLAMKRPRPRPPASWSSACTSPAGARVVDIGLADSVHDAGGEARPVVADRDRRPRRAPFGGDLDPAPGEIDGVLDEIGEALDDGRVAERRPAPGRALAGIDHDLRRRRRGRARPPPRSGAESGWRAR